MTMNERVCKKEKREKKKKQLKRKKKIFAVCVVRRMGTKWEYKRIAVKALNGQRYPCPALEDCG